MAGSSSTLGFFNGQIMWEASISSFDGEIRRRPYHRNCSCALHRSRSIAADSPCHSFSSVSFPLRRRSSSSQSLSSSFSSPNLADMNPRGSSDAIAFMIEDEE